MIHNFILIALKVNLILFLRMNKIFINLININQINRLKLILWLILI